MHQDMKNIKEQLEQVIKKKHNELFKIDYNMDYNTKLNLQRKILEDLADEVLKVVKNEMHEELNKYLCENLDLNNLGNEELRNDILQLLSNLSPNKENKNNE